MHGKILFLNLPHKLELYRRFLCSYHSPGYLLPPYDLVQLATCVREWNHAPVMVLDAIAEKRTEQEVYDIIEKEKPELIITNPGIEYFGDDMACIKRLQKQFPSIEVGIFGYYPTLFPEEVLQKSMVNFILCREPELPLSHYLEALEGKRQSDEIVGFAGRRRDGSLFYNPEKRLLDLDSLPFPDYSLVPLKLYKEAFVGDNCAAILSTRGCPFECAYCNTTYGRKTVRKSPERVADEMAYHVQQGARSIRFLDDTFTIGHDWVITLCKLIVGKQMSINWACLSRLDTVDEEMLEWMHRAGCRRMLIGIESYSPKILKHLNKNINPETINEKLRLMKKTGMELVGWFIVGTPVESEQDFEETIRGVLSSPLDFIAVNIMTPRAGTHYYEKMAEYYSFNLLPYACQLRDKHVHRLAEKRLKTLYRRFYFRPSVLLRHLGYVLRDPMRILKTVRALLLS